MTSLRLGRQVSRIAAGAALVTVLWAGQAHAECPPLPNTISNGQPADASKVMQDMNHLRDCLNGDTGTISTPSVSIESPSGPTATIKAPTVATSYDLNLPSGPGVSGQVLTSGGPGQQMVWSASGGGGGAATDGNPVSRPAASSLSWYNQGPATTTDHINGPLTFVLPPVNSNHFRALQVAPPSGGFTVTAKLDCGVVRADNFCGVHVIDDTNKIMMFGMGYSGLLFGYTTSTTSWYTTVKSTSVHSNPKWFRATRDSTNWTFSWSTNGADWVIHSVTPLTYYIGGNIVGAGVVGTNYATPTPAINMTIPIWSLEVKAGAGTDSHW